MLRRTDGRAPAALLLSMVSLCVGTSVAKTLFPVAGAGGMTSLRIGLAALLLVMVQRPWRWRVTREQGQVVLLYGLVLAGMNLSFYAAVARLPLGIAIAIEFLGPLAVAMLGSKRARDWLWVVLAAGGVALLVMPGRTDALDSVGVAFALAAALGWAWYIILGKRATQLVPEHRIVCLGLCAASLVAVPVGVAAAGATLIEPQVLATGALVALLCSAIPYQLELFALKRMPAATFGILVSLTPAVGAIAAFLVIGETIGRREWLGIIAVCAASIGSTLTRPRVTVMPA